MNLNRASCETQFFTRGKNPRFVTIYARIVYGPQRVQIGSLQIKIPTSQWDTKQRRVKPTHPQAEAHNRELSRLAERVDAAYLDLLRRNRETITAASIKAHLLNTKTGALTMSGAVTFYLEQKAVGVGTRITKATIQRNEGWGNNVLDFLRDAKLSEQLADEFTPAVADKLVRYLATVKKHKPGYINKHLDLVRAMLSAAHDAERIPRNPLKRYADLPEDDPDTTHLTEEEIARVEALTDLTPRLVKCRDFLLVAVETGAHYIDVKGIIEHGRIDTDADGMRWIVSKRQKTGKAIEVPVTPRLARLIEQYGGLEHLPMIANAQLNAFLKVVAERAGIKKNVTTKIGRKSFADARLNGDLLSADMTSAMLGLTSAQYLKHYGATRREGIKKALAERRGGRGGSGESTNEQP